EDGFVTPAGTQEVLEPLRAHLTDYEFFGLLVGSRRDSRALRAFFQHAAVSSRRRALFLLPGDLSSREAELLDPFPPVVHAAELEWPMVVFWLPDGASK